MAGFLVGRVVVVSDAVVGLKVGEYDGSADRVDDVGDVVVVALLLEIVVGVLLGHTFRSSQHGRYTQSDVGQQKPST